MKTSNYSTVLTVTTDPLSLDAPILDAMGTITYNSAVINWLPVDNAEGYKIYLENTDDTLVILDDLDVSNVTTYTLTGLYQNTNYQYKVKAYYHTVESSYSVIDDFVTADFVINAPTFTANTDLNQFGVTVNWGSISNATSYLIYVENLDISTVIMNDVNIGNVLTYTLDTLDPATNYRVKLKAYNPIETSSYSSNNDFTTFDPVPEFSPTMLTSTDITQTSIKFRWTSVTYADTYALEVYDDIALTNLIFSESGIVATEKNVTGLTVNTPYYARSNATNESGSSSWSSANTTNTLQNNLQKDSNTLFAYDCQDGIGGNINDSTLNNIDSILQGTNDANTWKSGLILSDTYSLDFNGTNNYLATSNLSNTITDFTGRFVYRFETGDKTSKSYHPFWGKYDTYSYSIDDGACFIVEYLQTINKLQIILYDNTYLASSPKARIYSCSFNPSENIDYIIQIAFKLIDPSNSNLNTCEIVINGIKQIGTWTNINITNITSLKNTTMPFYIAAEKSVSLADIAKFRMSRFYFDTCFRSESFALQDAQNISLA